MGIIKYSHAYWSSGELPREGKNVVKLPNSMDLSVFAFHIAWMETNMKAKKILNPKDLYTSYIMPDMAQILAPILKGDFCIISNPDNFEWWLTFEDSGLIFYSPGALC